MCAPAMLMMGVSAAVSLAGGAIAAKGAKDQAEAQAQQDSYNATVAKINARSERQKGYAEAETVGAKYDAQRGAGVALASKANVDPGYGSAALVLFGGNAEAEAHDKNNLYTNAEGKAIGNENSAKALEASAANHRAAGKTAAAASFLSGIGGAVKSFAGPQGGNNSLFLNG